jgi:hypothetical protein
VSAVFESVERVRFYARLSWQVFVDLGAYEGDTIAAWYMHPDFLSGKGAQTLGLSRMLGGGWVDMSTRIKSLMHLDREYTIRGMQKRKHRQKFCSIGVEGNPLFDGTLTTLSRELRTRGYANHMFNSTAVAVGNHNPVSFYVNKLVRADNARVAYRRNEQGK